MSYILEALKKSEKDRQREGIPGLQSDHSLPSVKREERKPPGWRLSALLILVLVCSGGLFWWQLTSDQELQIIEAREVVSALSASPVSPPAATQVSDESTIPATFVELSSKIREQISREVNQAVGLAANNISPAPATVSEKKSEAVMNTAERPIPRQVKTALPLMEELPFEIRAGIPDLTFAGHVYADVARKRLIIINNRIVREGDLIVSGLFLEQISPNGVVLRYETTLFRVILF